MAGAIIEALTSGFSLIGELATNMLTAFGTLFWDTTLNEGAGGLTSFATFALIMLSVSICFAVVALVFNLIKGNTGVN